VPKYLITGEYTKEGIQGLFKDKATNRVSEVRQTIEKVGGRLEAAYFQLGDDDVLLIAELPSNTVAAALCLAARQSGLVEVETTPLLTPEEVDQALIANVNYRGPGA